MVTGAADAARCRNNLRQIQDAKARSARDEHKTTNDTPNWSDLVGANRYLKSIPECPAGGVYTIGRVGEAAKCSNPDHTL